jgi:hypothetical protein
MSFHDFAVSRAAEEDGVQRLRRSREADAAAAQVNVISDFVKEAESRGLPLIRLYVSDGSSMTQMDGGFLRPSRRLVVHRFREVGLGFPLDHTGNDAVASGFFETNDFFSFGLTSGRVRLASVERLLLGEDESARLSRSGSPETTLRGLGPHYIFTTSQPSRDHVSDEAGDMQRLLDQLNFLVQHRLPLGKLL